MKIIQWDEIFSKSGRARPGARESEKKKQTTFVLKISFLRNKILKNKLLHQHIRTWKNQGLKFFFKIIQNWSSYTRASSFWSTPFFMSLNLSLALSFFLYFTMRNLLNQSLQVFCPFLQPVYYDNKYRYFCRHPKRHYCKNTMDLHSIVKPWLLQFKFTSNNLHNNFSSTTYYPNK